MKKTYRVIVQVLFNGEPVGNRTEHTVKSVRGLARLKNRLIPEGKGSGPYTGYGGYVWLSKAGIDALGGFRNRFGDYLIPIPGLDDPFCAYVIEE